MAETNINWNNGELYKKQIKKVRGIINDKKAMLIISDAHVPWRRTFKPGGTCILANGSIASHILKKNNDYPLGRWSTIEIGIKK